MTISSEIGMVCYWFDAISWVVNQQLKQLSHLCGPLIYCYTPILEPSDAPLVLVATRYTIKLHRSFRVFFFRYIALEIGDSMWIHVILYEVQIISPFWADGVWWPWLPRIPFNSRCNYVHLSRPFIYHWIYMWCIYVYIYLYIYILIYDIIHIYIYKFILYKVFVYDTYNMYVKSHRRVP